jgi:hypothetical protein
MVKVVESRPAPTATATRPTTIADVVAIARWIALTSL